ncbi:MAG: DNA repair helicase [Nitrosopumilales archaeon]|nr:MAG: DNA repair helicase [Nitrosopumilales archaeon]
MGLRDLTLKEEYRSDRDDIISEFFVPCLSNCIEYDRCIEYVSVKSLITLALGFENFVNNQAKMRIITGHRFRASDLDLLTKLMLNNKKEISFKGSFIRNSKLKILKEIVENHKLQVKIAIPNSEEIVGAFDEKIGIFLDENDDVVAFTGTSNETFNSQNRNFESVDIFTSWNDKSRVETKIKDFEELWENKTKYVDVYDFDYAEEKNLLKYTSQWALEFT